MADEGRSEAILAGILALLAEQRELAAPLKGYALKTEVLLGRAGVPNDVIGDAVGKSAEAVRKTIERAPAAGATKPAVKKPAVKKPAAKRSATKRGKA